MTLELKTSIKNKIAKICFYNEQKNSFTTKQLDELVKTLNELNKNPEVTIIILENFGNSVFCSGASFDELLKIENELQGEAFFSGFAKVILSMKNSSKLIIGHVKGKAVGGGVGLIAACDIALATKKSSIKLSEIAIGIGPFVIEPVVTKKIGKTAMTELTLNPTDWMDANWALSKGLYTKIFENEIDLESYLMAYCNQLSQYNNEALLEIKKIIWEDTAHWENLLFERAKISGKLVLSNFTKNTLKQFKKI